jgi:hypothetical protein
VIAVLSEEGSRYALLIDAEELGYAVHGRRAQVRGVAVMLRLPTQLNGNGDRGGTVVAG